MLPQASVIEAVEKLNYRVTVADVAVQSGLNLAIASQQVMNLATLTGGNMQVAESGEIAYVFDRNLRNTLLARSLKLRLLETWALIWKWLFWLIRISFGIMLVVSIVIVVAGILLAILAIQSQSKDDNRSDSSSRSGNSDGYGMGSFFPSWIYWGNPFSVFSPSYYDRGYSSRDSQVVIKAKESQAKVGFLEGVFSFLFGDGNPNSNLEERRYQAIAAVIRQNQGTVVAEQIAPYVDEVGNALQAEREDYLLPVMVKFNGYPKVSDQGTLAYSFPDLQKVAEQRSSEATSVYLHENTWAFSRAGKVGISLGLGGFYFGGALILGNLLQSPRVIAAVANGGALGAIASVYGFLLGYAILFLTIPAVRFLILKLLNSKIESRNQARLARTQVLANPDPELSQKLAFAKQQAIAQEVIDRENLAYTTETDYADQEFAKMQKEIEEGK
jgi:hypothetical protein